VVDRTGYRQAAGNREDLMGGASRLAVRVGTAAIAVALGLAACTEPGGGPAPAAPSATGRTTAGAAAQPSATVPVEGGQTTARLGIETQGGTFTPLIDRGTAVPATHSEIFTTAEDNQPTIKINVYQGVSDRVADAQHVGDYELTVPNPGPREGPQLSVTFSIDASGAFRLTATDSTTEAPVTVSILD
jgi:molecular chaperone DnaK (HSP70)